VTTLAHVPSQITAGDSVALTLVFPDHPAPTWTLSLALAGASTAVTVSTPNGTAHDLALTAAETSGLAAGLYRWRVRATSGATATTLTTGTLTVAADVATLTAGQGVSYWQTLKEAAQSALVTLMEGGGVQMSTILGRQTMFRSPQDCLAVIAQCDAQLAAAQSRTFGTPALFNVVGMR
jgi:hypothetical protein